MPRLDGKVAIITGGARGQGAAEARLFTNEGADVILADLLDGEGELLATDLGGKTLYRHLDVTDPEGWEALVNTVTDRYGHIDVLVNNAGIFTLSSMQKPIWPSGSAS